MGNYPSLWRSTFGNPFREIARLQQSMDRFLDEFHVPAADGALAKYAFNPSCEFTEDKNQYLAKFDLPGVTRDQIKIDVDDNRLTVSGERKEEKKEEGKKQHVSETYYGSFMRSFTLPTPINPEKVQATFENGVLTIALAKSEASKSRQITIK